MENKDMDLYEKLSYLQSLLHRQHIHSHAERGPMDPTRGQGRVLAMLKLQPEISSKDLSYLLGIRQQSLNELLNKLERKEYITRTPSEADKRVMMVRLTEKGRDDTQKPVENNDIFRCLNEEEQVLFSDYLDRIIAVLEAQMDENDEDFNEWMHAARERMGEDQFDHLIRRHGRHGFLREPGPHGRGRGGDHFHGPEHRHGPDHRHKPDHRQEPGLEPDAEA